MLSADMAQSAEHILGKDEVVGSIPTISSSCVGAAAKPYGSYLPYGFCFTVQSEYLKHSTDTSAAYAPAIRLWDFR